MKKEFLFPLGVIVFMTLTSTSPLTKGTTKAEKKVTKGAEQLFSNWIEWQTIFEPTSITLSQSSITKNLTQTWKTHKIKKLNSMFPEFFKAILDDKKPDQSNYITHAQEHLKDIYTYTQTDIPALIKKLKSLSLGKKNDASNENIEKEVENYLALTNFLYGQPGDTEDSPLLFSVANHFAHYLISQKTFPQIKGMFSRKENYPLLKMLYATIWYHLASIGWKTWSSTCIKNLKKAAEQGKRIIYLAGGSDIYQLITNGIYNITVIDPQLPTQTEYYAQGWKWIIKSGEKNGGMGDTITFKDHDIKMVRTAYSEESKTFTAQVATKKEGVQKTVAINPSKTTWTITTKAGKKLGTCILDRRFINQEDFSYNPESTLLISFNEMFFISVPDELDGWHIDPNLMPKRTKLIVKQLHKPVTQEMLCNLRTISMLNYKKLEFISLGSSVT